MVLFQTLVSAYIPAALHWGYTDSRHLYPSKPFQFVVLNNTIAADCIEVSLLQLYTIGERGDWLAAPPGYASPVVPSKRYTAQIIVLILSTYRFWRPHVCGGADYRIWR